MHNGTAEICQMPGQSVLAEFINCESRDDSELIKAFELIEHLEPKEGKLMEHASRLPSVVLCVLQ